MFFLWSLLGRVDCGVVSKEMVEKPDGARNRQWMDVCYVLGITETLLES
jgi:hypothetical protein